MLSDNIPREIPFYVDQLQLSDNELIKKIFHVHLPLLSDNVRIKDNLSC